MRVNCACGLGEMTKLDRESAVVFSRASVLQHILECWHASFRRLLGVRVGRLKVTGLTKLVMFGVVFFFVF